MKGFRVVVVDGGYDAYETERRLLAPPGAEVLVQPCEGDGARVAAAIPRPASFRPPAR